MRRHHHAEQQDGLTVVVSKDVQDLQVMKLIRSTVEFPERWPGYFLFLYCFNVVMYSFCKLCMFVFATFSPHPVILEVVSLFALIL